MSDKTVVILRSVTFKGDTAQCVFSLALEYVDAHELTEFYDFRGDKLPDGWYCTIRFLEQKIN